MADRLLPDSDPLRRDDAIPPSSDEELWVITRSENPTKPNRSSSEGGGLWVQDGVQLAPIPLASMDAKAHLAGDVASVQVTQRFQNPYTKKIEAIYQFPLPEHAAIHDFLIKVGHRKIRGVVRERAEATRIYSEAKQQGYVASLMTQERPNIFTQSVANLEPGHAIDVTIDYYYVLPYLDGWHEFVFPMVVGDRFDPRKPDASGWRRVGKSHAWGREEPKPIESTPRLDLDSTKHPEVKIQLSLDSKVEEYECATHNLVRSDRPGSGPIFELANPQEIPDRDFVFRYRVSTEKISSHVETFRQGEEGYFRLTLYPPLPGSALPRVPLELIFVIDCSGSMDGAPITQAKQAVEHALEQLQPNDTFQVITFSMTASQLGPSPLEATPRNIRRAKSYLQSLSGEGGTMMLHGIKAALRFEHDPSRLRYVCFLTDGFIGNEAEILREVHAHLGKTRIFSFGVGSSPNRFLLDRLAHLGAGAVGYLNLTDDPTRVMDNFLARISRPALSDIRLDWEGAAVNDVQPSRIPDLVAGRALSLSGRFHGHGKRTLRVVGRLGSETVELVLDVDLDANEPGNEALVPLWARSKITSLSDRAIWEYGTALRSQIRSLALQHQLLSAYTAFLAVDTLFDTGDQQPRKIRVPTATPLGMEN